MPFTSLSRPLPLFLHHTKRIKPKLTFFPLLCLPCCGLRSLGWFKLAVFWDMDILGPSTKLWVLGLLTESRKLSCWTRGGACARPCTHTGNLPGQDNYGRQCFLKWTVCSCLLNSLVINILFKRILGHVLQLHWVSFRSRGEVRNISSVKALLCFQQGSPGDCSASLVCCVRIGSRFCYGWFSGRGILEGLCICFCTGCIIKITLRTHSSITKGELFCPDVSITS